LLLLSAEKYLFSGNLIPVPDGGLSPNPETVENCQRRVVLEAGRGEGGKGKGGRGRKESGRERAKPLYLASWFDSTDIGAD
jgi:hypothetical protein